MKMSPLLLERVLHIAGKKTGTFKEVEALPLLRPCTHIPRAMRLGGPLRSGPPAGNLSFLLVVVSVDVQIIEHSVPQITLF